MTFAELVNRLHAVDKEHKGCSLTLTAILSPPHDVVPYGTVTLGMNENKHVFHSESELQNILKIPKGRGI